MADQISVFLSYRRDDTQSDAGRLFDRLDRDPRFRLFFDVDSIDGGQDFTKVVQEALDECEVFLAVIGPKWLSLLDQTPLVDRRRRDFVVEEIKDALDRDIDVFPILVNQARMPEEHEVPPVLVPFTKRHALRLRFESYSADVEHIINRIDQAAKARAAARRKVSPPTTDLSGDPEYSRAVAAAYKQRWDQAEKLLLSVQSRFPDHPDVLSRLETAGTKARLARLAASASAAESEGNWRAAVDAFEQLLAADPNYPDAAQRLAAARTSITIADLSNELRALYHAGEWVGVVEVSKRIAALDEGRADPGGLASQARDQLESVEVERVYAAGVGHLSAREYPAAEAAFEFVHSRRPGYRDADKLLARAQHQVRLATWQRDASRAESSGDWDLAANLLTSIANLDPHNEHARARLARAQARREEIRAERARQDQRRAEQARQEEEQRRREQAERAARAKAEEERRRREQDERDARAKGERERQELERRHRAEQVSLQRYKQHESRPNGRLILALIVAYLSGLFLLPTATESASDLVIALIHVGAALAVVGACYLLARHQAQAAPATLRGLLRRWFLWSSGIGLAFGVLLAFVLAAIARGIGDGYAVVVFFLVIPAIGLLGFFVGRRWLAKLAVWPSSVYCFAAQGALFATVILFPSAWL